VHTLRRSAAIGLASLLMLALAAPALASVPGGHSAAAMACQAGGFRDYTDVEGNAFRNAGHCVRYAAAGGQLVPVDEEPTAIDLTVTFGQPSEGRWSVHVEWSGLEPGSALIIRWSYDSDEYVELDAGSLNATGEGSWHPPFTFACVDEGNPFVSATATATPAGGSEQTYAVPLPSVCAP
jgi:hypothetical protein